MHTNIVIYLYIYNVIYIYIYILYITLYILLGGEEEGVLARRSVLLNGDCARQFELPGGTGKVCAACDRASSGIAKEATHAILNELC